MMERSAKVASKLGLHARASARLVQVANAYRSRITIRHVASGRSVDAKSIFGVMMLAATAGTELSVSASGIDELAAAEAIARVIEEPDGV
ncbi:MAG: HPr family phosphocarrier protein [Acidobacteria bacterium]|nr:HPr family phosphocarrier protein [Acidobacteriota bacterium]